MVETSNRFECLEENDSNSSSTSPIISSDQIEINQLKISYWDVSSSTRSFSSQQISELKVSMNKSTKTKTNKKTKRIKKKCELKNEEESRINVIQSIPHYRSLKINSNDLSLSKEKQYEIHRNSSKKKIRENNRRGNTKCSTHQI